MLDYGSGRGRCSSLSRRPFGRAAKLRAGGPGLGGGVGSTQWRERAIFVDNVSKLSLGGSTWAAQCGCPRDPETPGGGGPRSPTPTDTFALSPPATHHTPSAVSGRHAPRAGMAAGRQPCGRRYSNLPTANIEGPAKPTAAARRSRQSGTQHLRQGRPPAPVGGRSQRRLQLQVEDEVTNERGRQRAVFNGQTWEWQRDGAEATRENRPGS